MRFCCIVILFRYCFWSKSQQGSKIGIYNHSFFFDDRYFVGIDICYASPLYAYHGRGVKVVYPHAYDSDVAVSGKKEETAQKNLLKRRFVPRNAAPSTYYPSTFCKTSISITFPKGWALRILLFVNLLYLCNRT